MDTVVALIAGILLISALVFTVGTVLAIFSKTERRPKILRRSVSAVVSVVLAVVAAGFMSDEAKQASVAKRDARQADRAAQAAEAVSPALPVEPVADPALGEYRNMPTRQRSEALGGAMVAAGIDQAGIDDFTRCLGYYIPQNPDDTDLSVAVGWCDFDRINNPEKFAAHRNEMDEPDMSTKAAVICNNLVRQSLKSPSSAKFPWVPDMSRRPNRDYYVTSYVDSQNGFGAMIRTDFTCNVRYVSDDFDAWDSPDSWDVVELNFLEM